VILVEGQRGAFDIRARASNASTAAQVFVPQHDERIGALAAVTRPWCR